MNSTTLMQVLPWLGWVLLLLGWLGQRHNLKVQKQVWSNQVSVQGSHNQVDNRVDFQQTHSPTNETPPSKTSTLEQASQWATVAGLLISLWPLFKNFGA